MADPRDDRPIPRGYAILVELTTVRRFTLPKSERCYDTHPCCPHPGGATGPPATGLPLPPLSNIPLCGTGDYAHSTGVPLVCDELTSDDPPPWWLLLFGDQLCSLPDNPFYNQRKKIGCAMLCARQYYLLLGHYGHPDWDWSPFLPPEGCDGTIPGLGLFVGDYWDTIRAWWRQWREGNYAIIIAFCLGGQVVVSPPALGRVGWATARLRMARRVRRECFLLPHQLPECPCP
jgi:hypothetical protein